MSTTIGARAGAWVVAGLATMAGLAGCDVSTTDASAPASPAASAEAVNVSGSDAPSAPADGGSHSAPLTVVRPNTLGGRPRVEANDSTSTEDSFKTTKIVNGVYGDVGKQDLIFLLALASTDLTPQARLSFVMSEATSEFKVSSYQTIDPGAPGGLVRCGDGTLNGVQAAICVWSDDGSNGVLVQTLKDAADFKGGVAGLRAEIEKAA